MAQRGGIRCAGTRGSSGEGDNQQQACMEGDRRDLAAVESALGAFLCVSRGLRSLSERLFLSAEGSVNSRGANI